MPNQVTLPKAAIDRMSDNAGQHLPNQVSPGVSSGADMCMPNSDIRVGYHLGNLVNAVGNREPL